MLFIMRSPSCGGKSTFVKEHFPSGGNIISTDFFRQMLTGDINNQKNNKEVFDLVRQVIETRLAMRVTWTVYDATNLRMKDVSPIIELCKKYHTPFTFICIEPPSIEDMIERGKKRWMETEHGVGQAFYEDVLRKHHNRYINSFEPFKKEATYNDLCTLIEINQDYEVINEI